MLKGLLILTFIWPQLLCAVPTAKEIIQKSDSAMRGDQSYSRVEIIVEKPRFKRTIVLDSYDSRKNDRFFIRILKPKKDENTTFLKVKQNFWQYIPSIGREIKIEASLLADSWMGSDFTNDDLIKQVSIVDDYEHAFLEQPLEGYYKIQMIPKPASPAVWAKIILTLRKGDCLPVKEEFYDHQGRLKKVMLLSDFKVMDGRMIPCKVVMSSLENQKVISRTTLINLKVQFKQKIPESVFSKANLRKAQ